MKMNKRLWQDLDDHIHGRPKRKHSTYEGLYGRSELDENCRIVDALTVRPVDLSIGRGKQRPAQDVPEQGREDQEGRNTVSVAPGEFSSFDRVFRDMRFYGTSIFPEYVRAEKPKPQGSYAELEKRVAAYLSQEHVPMHSTQQATLDSELCTGDTKLSR